MGIDVKAYLKVILDGCEAILNMDDVTPATKIEALKLIEHTVEAVVGMNIQAQSMNFLIGGNEDDGK